jgi:hypothetical protein
VAAWGGSSLGSDPPATAQLQAGLQPGPPGPGASERMSRPGCVPRTGPEAALGSLATELASGQFAFQSRRKVTGNSGCASFKSVARLHTWPAKAGPCYFIFGDYIKKESICKDYVLTLLRGKEDASAEPVANSSSIVICCDFSCSVYDMVEFYDRWQGNRLIC